MFSMHVACDMHTTLYSQYCDMHVSLNMHGSCMQYAHYMQEISTRGYTHICDISKGADTHDPRQLGFSSKGLLAPVE